MGYNVVQLLAALDLDSNHQPLDHGKMTAVIGYKRLILLISATPYLFLVRWETICPSGVCWVYQSC